MTDDRLQLLVPLAPNLPKFVRDAVDAAADIYHRPQLFPEITGLTFAPKTRIRRRRRSWLRALALTVAAFARRCDRRTFRVGDQLESGLCNGVPVSELRRATGLSLTTQKRAIAFLKSIGYQQTGPQPVVAIAPRSNLRRSRRGRPPLQAFAGLPAVRVLTPLLFRRLGFTARKITKARKRAYQEWTLRRAPVASAVQIHEARRELQKLTSANEQRERRLAVSGTASALQERAPERHSSRLDDENAARLARLQLRLRPPPA